MGHHAHFKACHVIFYKPHPVELCELRLGSMDFAATAGA